MYRTQQHRPGSQNSPNRPQAGGIGHDEFSISSHQTPVWAPWPSGSMSAQLLLGTVQGSWAGIAVTRGCQHPMLPTKALRETTMRTSLKPNGDTAWSHPREGGDPETGSLGRTGPRDRQPGEDGTQGQGSLAPAWEGRSWVQCLAQRLLSRTLDPTCLCGCLGVLASLSRLLSPVDAGPCSCRGAAGRLAGLG